MKWKQLRKDLELYFSRKFNFPFVAPNNVTLNLTYRCNQNCIMCSIKKENIDPKVELTLSEIKDIVDQMADWRIPEIVFTGGEPLILPDIFAMINYAAKKHIRPVLITNCFCSKDIIKKLKVSSVDHIQVSVDGANPETHDFIRESEGSFDVTINNLKELISMPDRKFSIHATTTIVNQNIDQLIDITSLMKEIGMEKLSIRPVHNDNTNPKLLDARDSSYWIPKNRLSILNDQIDKLSNYHKETGFIDCRPGFEYIKEYYKNGYIKATNSCYNGYNRLIIAYNECDTYEIWMCGGMIGDIRRNNLRKLWTSKRAKNIRKIIKKCKNSCAFPSCYEFGLESLFSIIKKRTENK